MPLETLDATRSEEPAVELKPARLSQFLGQSEAVEFLSIKLTSCRMRADIMEHTVLFGPAGLGKSTLAGIIAAEMGTRLHVVMAPAVEKAADLASILLSLDEGDVLFLDEIHHLDRRIAETFYTAITDFKLQITTPDVPGHPSAVIALDLKRFTLVGATTNPGRMPGPMRQRFPNKVHLRLYNPDEMRAIIRRNASLLELDMTNEAVAMTADRSRGTPRIANALLKHVRDYVVVKECDVVDATLAQCIFDWLKIADDGLDEAGRAYLTVLRDRLNGGPAGLKSIAVAMGEAEDFVSEDIEPWLVMQGYINRTRSGRVLAREVF